MKGLERGGGVKGAVGGGAGRFSGSRGPSWWSVATVPHLLLGLPLLPVAHNPRALSSPASS